MTFERHPGDPIEIFSAAFAAAPEDQRIDGFFRGDEAFTVEHMHRRGRRAVASLLGD